MARIKVEAHPMHPDDLVNLTIKVGNATTVISLMFNEANKLVDDIRKWMGQGYEDDADGVNQRRP